MLSQNLESYINVILNALLILFLHFQNWEKLGNTYIRISSRTGKKLGIKKLGILSIIKSKVYNTGTNF